MKHIAAAILSLFLIVALAEAQPGGSVRDRIAGKQTQKKQEGNKSSQLTVRAENANIDLSSSIETAPWMRIVYREIDLTKDKNLPLYEGPTTPDGIQLDNLFTMMFRLVISW